MRAPRSLHPLQNTFERLLSNSEHAGLASFTALHSICLPCTVNRIHGSLVRHSTLRDTGVTLASTPSTSSCWRATSADFHPNCELGFSIGLTRDLTWKRMSHSGRGWMATTPRRRRRHGTARYGLVIT